MSLLNMATKNWLHTIIFESSFRVMFKTLEGAPLLPNITFESPLTNQPYTPQADSQTEQVTLKILLLLTSQA